jgi:muramoyltetrapeptide carboxypeptidase LdcA involved in peptidoglycan recycling
MTSNLRPKALRAGDTVAVVALSGGLEEDDAELFRNGVEVIRALGFDVRVSPLVGIGRAWSMTSFAAVWNNLHALRYTGVFDRVAGLIVGSPWEVAPTQGGPETLRELILDVLGDRDIPVLGNVDVGHNPPNIPMPLGSAPS